MKIGPPRGGQREGAPAMRDKSKRRASPLPKAGPSKRAWGEPALAGPPSPTVYSPTSGTLVEPSMGGSWSIVEAFLQRRAEELERLLATRREEVHRVGEERDGFQRELDEARKEQDLACRDKDIAVGTAMEQLSQLQELRACMRPLEMRAQVAGQQSERSEMWGTQRGPSVEVTQATAERARRQEEWLANKAALGQWGVLHWAREHHILLDGASVALRSIHNGLVRMPRDLLPELGQGVTQMGRLLVGHRRRAMADPRAWWEVAVDMAEPLPGHSEVLAMVVAQLEVDLVGRITEADSGGGGGAEILLQHLVHSFCLSVGLRVIGSGEGSMVGDDVVWESVLGEYMFKKQFGELRSIVGGVAGDEEGLLGEAANNDEDHVKTFRIGEFNDMIHQ
ncbi:hypothetical protein E4T56_gene18538 [Termitomyces sp. T112]|nr:hypothetical protein E4T56_gene18538 [Termitomyces sp. T112]